MIIVMYSIAQAFRIAIIGMVVINSDSYSVCGAYNTTGDDGDRWIRLRENRACR